MPKLQKDDVFRILSPERVAPHPYNITCKDDNRLGVVADYAAADSDECNVGDSLWVVTGTEVSGGGTGHGPHDVYPDGYGVRACEVEGGGKATGRTVFFYQSGCFNNLLEEGEIEVVGKVVASKTLYSLVLDS